MYLSWMGLNNLTFPASFRLYIPHLCWLLPQDLQQTSPLNEEGRFEAEAQCRHLLPLLHAGNLQYL